MTIAMAMAMLVSAGITRPAAQESVSPAPASPVEGGKVIKEKPKAMTAVGAVKTVAADSLAISDATGKDWTFVIDAKTKIVPKTSKEASMSVRCRPSKAARSSRARQGRRRKR